MTVDVARGVGEDYSNFVVVDITSFPHKVVAKYRNNDIKPMLFPTSSVSMGSYNSAFILCEVMTLEIEASFSMTWNIRIY